MVNGKKRVTTEEEIKFAFKEEFSTDYLNHFYLKEPSGTVEFLWMGFACGYRCGETNNGE